MKKNTGTITSIHMPIIEVRGLTKVRPQELVELSDGNKGIILNCSQDMSEIMVLKPQAVSLKTTVTATGGPLTLNVGDQLLGTVISPLGEVLLGKSNRKSVVTEKRAIDVSPPSLQKRKPLSEPLFTGLTIIDSLLPLARGQRELIAGDRKTSKTPILLQIMLAQVQQKSKVVYCLIGKRKEEVRSLVDLIEKHEIGDSVVVVSSNPLDSASEIALTPFTAMTVAEYFRDRGENVLIILDDLTTHAKYYREVSLLARSFPGRDSYPGDIFYVHARLLERAGGFVVDGKRNTIAITALPVAETLDNEMTDYIVSNLISITDGHLLFDTHLLQQGHKPPINTSLSVTRVGKQVQTRLQRSLNRELSIFLNTYYRLLSLAHFGSELSPETAATLKRGAILTAFLHQNWMEIVPLSIQIAGCSLILQGEWDNADDKAIGQYRKALSEHYRLSTKAQQYFDTLMENASFADLTKALHKDRTKLKQLWLS